MTQTDIANVPAPPEPFNFAQHLLALNASRPDRIAFVDDLGRVAYGEVADRVRRLAAGLRALGLKREERVLLLMQDSADWRTVWARIAGPNDAAEPPVTGYGRLDRAPSRWSAARPTGWLARPASPLARRHCSCHFRAFGSSPA